MITKLMRGTEVAEFLGISKALAYRLISQGSLPAVKFGRTVRVVPADLDRWIAAHQTDNDASKTNLKESM